MIVTAVIVTYGDRFCFLEKVIFSLIEENVDKIVVVLNGILKSSKDKIFLLQKTYPEIHLLDLGINTGSAGGFYNGIKKAIKLQTDFIWLLDDDNKPEKEALHNLLKHTSDIAFSHQKDALLSFRKDRPLYLSAKNNNNGSLMLKEQNAALGFSVFSSKTSFSNYNKTGLKVAPYGGLFFHKDLIDKIGLPDQSYFLYGDDFDFSIRISKNNGKILLVEESEITDIEKSFHLREKKWYQTRFHLTDNYLLIEYSVRNGIVFELSYIVKSKLNYVINLFLYSLIVSFLLLLSLEFKKTKAFLKGVFRGYAKANKS